MDQENRQGLDQPGLFYGWFMVAAGFFILCFAMGTILNCYSLFVKPICEDLGYARQQIALNASLHSCGQMTVALFSGKIFKRFKPRTVMIASAVVMTAATVSYSFATSLPMFYLSAILVGLSMGGITTVPLSLIISNWFHQKRGTAIGICFTGSGVGGMIFSPIVGKVIVQSGWRAAFLVLAGVMAVTLLPLALFIKNSPKDKGLRPLGEGREITNIQEIGDGVTLSEAKGTAKFWLILGVSVVMSASSGPLMNTLSPYLTDLGYDYSFAAMMASLSMGALAVGKTALGQIYDRVGNRKATALAGVAAVLGLASMVFAQNKIALAPYLVGTGFACAFGSVAYPILTRALFGEKDYTSIYGVVSFANSLGVAISPIIATWFYDNMGSYRYAYYVMIVAAVVATTIFVRLLPNEKKAQEVQA